MIFNLPFQFLYSGLLLSPACVNKSSSILGSSHAGGGHLLPGTPGVSPWGRCGFGMRHMPSMCQGRACAVHFIEHLICNKNELLLNFFFNHLWDDHVTFLLDIVIWWTILSGVANAETFLSSWNALHSVWHGIPQRNSLCCWILYAG